VLRLVLFLASAAVLSAQGPAAADLAASIKNASLDPEQCYLVRDLNLTKDDIKLYFNDGYLIFSAPVAGERLTAIFAGVAERADGELLLLPPRRGERQSLAKFTGRPNLDEHFHTALLAFTDGSGQSLLDEIAAGGRGRPDPEAGRIMAERWNGVVANLADSFVQRIAADLLSPVRPGGGFLFATLSSDRLGNFDVLYEPLGEEQIVAGQLTDRGSALAYDVWTSFAARSYRNGTLQPEAPPFRVERYRITAFLDQDLSLRATTRATMRIGADPQRALLFGLSRAETVSAVRVDGRPVEVLFRDSLRGRALRPDQNDVFMVVAPELLAPGSVHEIEFEHQGAVIEDRGAGVYALAARANWYPRARMEFAEYELEFRFPKELTLVTPGEVVDDRIENEWRITRRLTPPIRVAGFNLGNYALASKVTDGLTVHVYGNRGLDPALAPRPVATVIPATRGVRPPVGRGGRADPLAAPLTIVQTPVPPDPLARLEAVATDVSTALLYFTGLFGPPPLKTLTVSPIPGTAGQGFPGLIYLSTLSYLDPEARPQSARTPRDQTFFSELMVAHEVAHQWWGNTVTSASYQDDWILEALANYSAMLWIEKQKGRPALERILNDFRADLQLSGDGGPYEAFGPLAWGYRLEAARSAETWRVITYEKGAWVFHMLRQRLGDEAFFAMLAELRRRYQGSDVSTQDLQRLVEQFLPPGSGDAAEVFFENWVYSTGVPSLRVRYSTSGRAPTLRLAGVVEQVGVPEGFSVDVPVRIEFARAAPQTVWVRTGEGGGRFSMNLRETPTRVAIPPGSVLTR
jgi:hypothetical protein